MNYDEIQPNRELRAYARRQLNGVWGKMAFAFFILFLLYLPYNFFSFLDSIMDSDEFYFVFIMDLIDGYMPDIVPFIPLIANVLAIAVLAAVGPFALGFAGFFLKRIRGEEIMVENIFDGFKRFFSGFLVMFFYALFTVLWGLLLVIPGIIKAFGYSMAFYIMYDNPEIKPLEALKKSQIMMKGYKWKLFLLQLSFIGWMLLASLTFWVGFLWLNPYMYLSMANFYENLKRNQENKAAKTPVDFFQYS
jgi:uncharacterized membrane protein